MPFRVWERAGKAQFLKIGNLLLSKEARISRLLPDKFLRRMEVKVKPGLKGKRSVRRLV